MTEHKFIKVLIVSEITNHLKKLPRRKNGNDNLPLNGNYQMLLSHQIL